MSLTYTYATQARMESRLTATSGAKYIQDAAGTSDTGVWTNVIESATNTANLYLLTRYSGQEATLAANDYVLDRTTDIANYELCRQRGDTVPASIKEAYLRALNEFLAIKNGLLNIPGMTPTGRKGWILSIPVYQADHRTTILPTQPSEILVVDEQGIVSE